MDLRRKLASRKKKTTLSGVNLLGTFKDNEEERHTLEGEIGRNLTLQVVPEDKSPGIGSSHTLPINADVKVIATPPPKIDCSSTLPIECKTKPDFSDTYDHVTASGVKAVKAFCVARALVTDAPDIKVKVETEEGEPCLITSIIPIPPTTVLVADYEPSHASIKAIDITENLICARLPLQSRPWGLAALPNNQVAITLPEKKQIDIIEANDGLSYVRDFEVQGKCQGIDATDDKLVVSFLDPCEIQVMDFFGSLLYSINAYRPGLPSLQAPYYVSTANEEGSEIIYVSDFNCQIVFKMTIDGEIVYIYKHLCAPTGVHATGDGHVIVCDFTAYNIFVVSKEGKIVRCLANKRRLPMKPWSVCHWPEQGKFFVGSNRDVLKVFELT